MQSRVMGEEIEYAKIIKELNQQNKYLYRFAEDEFIREIFHHLLPPRYPLQINQDGFFMLNGGQIRYESTGCHVEISTPECLNLYDLVAYDKALELIAFKFSVDTKVLNSEIILHKKNSDFNGNTRGCHENYCVEPWFVRELETINDKMNRKNFSPEDIDERLWHFLLFMETRQILSGSGGLQLIKNKNKDAVYCISPRADYINLNFGRSTTSNESRGIIDKTRTIEPLADPCRFGRLHLICGDANMSEISNYLKFGTTAAVLEMIENNAWDKNLDPVDPDWEAKLFKKISHDLSCKNVSIRLLNGKTYSAIGIQKLYQERWHEYVKALGFPEEKARLSELWKEALECLERDDEKAYRLFDWKIKRRAISNYSEKKSLLLNHNRLLTIDLEYHNPDPEKGFYNKLKNKNLVERIVSDQDIERAVELPPANTRAKLRRHLVDIFKTLNIQYTMKWETVSFKSERFKEFDFKQYTNIDLPDPLAYDLEVFDNQPNKISILILEDLKNRKEQREQERKESHGQAGKG